MAEEKSKTTLLKEKIMMTEPKGVKALSEEEIKKADSFCNGYKKFLDNSPVEREAVRYTVELAKKAGFAEYEQDKEYKAGDRLYYVNRDKAVALVVIGKNGVKNGARLAIAHIDSPRVDLKPNPLFEANNLAFFKTHYYGGLKKYQWTTIPLSLHGSVVKLDGTRVDICWGDDENESCFCITDLLPHLAREQASKPMAKAIEGENLNVILGSRPYDADSDEKGDAQKELEYIEQALTLVKESRTMRGLAELHFKKAGLLKELMQRNKDMQQEYQKQCQVELTMAYYTALVMNNVELVQKIKTTGDRV